MSGILAELGAGKGRPWLVVAATDKELAALAPEAAHLELLRCGVGKAPAAATTARTLSPDRHAGVLSIGLAGALPGSGLSVGDIVIATRMVLADEGSENPDGFIDLGAMGFGPMHDRSVFADADPTLTRALAAALPDARLGIIATVSTCSGTDARAAAIVARIGAIAEAMEGAAVALAAQLVAGPTFPALEIRAISNFTGDRPNQRWDLDTGFAALRRIAKVL